LNYYSGNPIALGGVPAAEDGGQSKIIITRLNRQKTSVVQLKSDYTCHLPRAVRGVRGRCQGSRYYKGVS
jgi:hypothetical protein